MGGLLRLAGPGEPPAPPAPGELVVCPDEPARVAWREAGARAALVERGIFDLPASVPVRDWCLELSESWRLDASGKDFTEWEGVSLGRALEGAAWTSLFGPAYKFAHALDGLLEAEKPSRVLADRRLWRERKPVAEALCRARGIPLEWTGEGDSPADPLLNELYTSPLTRHAGKRRLLDALTWFTRPRRGKRVLASYYFTLEGALDLLGGTDGIVPAFYDWPSKRLFRMGSWTRWRFLTDAGPEPAPDLSALSARWEAVKKDPAYAKRFEKGGLPLWETARGLLDRAVGREFSLMAAQLLRLRRSLDRWTPDLVVLPYDGSPVERLLLVEARRRAIPTAIVLHGIPAAGRHNRLMDTQADHVFIGGPRKIPTYRSLGVPEGRIHDTGFPLLDRYSAGKRKPRSGPPHVLVLSHYGAVQENILPVMDALRRWPELKVTVKMHPGESTELYRRVLGERLSGNVVLEDRWNLSELLTEVDLVIGGPTTGLVEAMALGLPVELVNLQGIEATPPFDGESGLPCRRTREELEAALAVYMPGRIPAKVDHGPLLTEYAGRPDGGCTRRTVDGLLSLLGR